MKFCVEEQSKWLSRTVFGGLADDPSLEWGRTKVKGTLVPEGACALAVMKKIVNGQSKLVNKVAAEKNGRFLMLWCLK